MLPILGAVIFSNVISGYVWYRTVKKTGEENFSAGQRSTDAYARGGADREVALQAAMDALRLEASEGVLRERELVDKIDRLTERIQRQDALMSEATEQLTQATDNARRLRAEKEEAQQGELTALRDTLRAQEGAQAFQREAEQRSGQVEQLSGQLQASRQEAERLSEQLLASIEREQLANAEVERLTQAREAFAGHMNANSQQNPLTDPITLAQVTDPRILPSGFTLSRSTIEAILREARNNRRSPECPITRRRIPSVFNDENYPPNRALVDIKEIINKAEVPTQIREDAMRQVRTFLITTGLLAGGGPQNDINGAGQGVEAQAPVRMVP